MTAPGADRILDPEPKYWPLWVLLSGWVECTETWLRSIGGAWLRRSIRVFWAAIAFSGLVLLMGPVINQPLTLNDITGSAQTVTERWIAREFATDYRITRDADGALTAQVEERISAFFPEDVTASEIERVLATQYQDHALVPRDFTATLDGVPIAVVESHTPNFVTLKLENESPLHGDHVFVLRYNISHLAYPARDDRLETSTDFLEWDVLGPSWPQGIAGIDATITLPQELDNELVREPRGGVAWLILSDVANLTPEPDSASGEVTYRFTNEQRLPPHANAWFTMTFTSGTFAMPAPDAFYWVKVFGPVIPLVILLLTFLFTLAARAVAWSDARGAAWYVAQSSPPKDISPAMAAQILERPGARELSAALRALQNAAGGREIKRANLIASARVARRTGRMGDVPFALSQYFTAPERRRQIVNGIRRIPEGFVRDFFLWSPVALTLVQWGLVRQLSHQRTTELLWWPFTFVIASSVIALLIFWIAKSQRPLTEKGALLKQHLRGVDAFSSQTQLLDRGTSSDMALPYAVLFGHPRTVGKRVVALIESELSESGVSRHWRTSNFLTWTRLLVRALSVALVVGAIIFVSVAPGYAVRHDPASYQWGPSESKDSWSEVASFDAEATLMRSPEGMARLVVAENLSVIFTHEGTRISQFAQQWPNRVDGQKLGVEVTRFVIDDKPVPYVTEQDGDTLLLRTKLIDALEGEHQVRLEYVVNSAAVAAESEGKMVDRVRWAALLKGWKYDYYWDADPGMKRMRIKLTMSSDLDQQSTSGGWITRDTSSANSAWISNEAVLPFRSKVIGENTVSYQLVMTRDENDFWPSEFSFTDLGSRLDFPAGTFAGPDSQAFSLKHTLDRLPPLVGLSIAALSIALGGYGVFAGARRRRRVFQPGLVRDAVRWLQPALVWVTFLAFVWLTFDAPSSHPLEAPLGLSTLAAITVAVASLIVTRRSRAVVRDDAEH